MALPLDSGHHHWGFRFLYPLLWSPKILKLYYNVCINGTGSVMKQLGLQLVNVDYVTWLHINVSTVLWSLG